jgi:mono/diheme cytochrome c family protein
VSARRVVAISALAVMSGVSGCVAPRALVPAREPATSTSTPVPRNYANACGTCHDRGGFGVQVLAARLGAAKSLLHAGTQMPAEAIRVIVRQGLGAMPAMSRLEVSDSELDSIVAYLGRHALAPSAP